MIQLSRSNPLNPRPTLIALSYPSPSKPPRLTPTLGTKPALVTTMNTMNAEQTRAISHVNRCRTAFLAAMQARDSIELSTSREWRLAHAAAKTAAVAKDNAFRHAYNVGALPKPYWA